MRSAAAAILAATLALLCALPAQADDLTPEKKADIEKLIGLTGALSRVEQISEIMINQTTAAIRNRRPDIPPQVLDVVREEINGVVKDNLPSLLAPMEVLYHRHFTHEEVKQVIAFYETDVGRKMIREIPALLKESMALGGAWGESLGPQIDSRIRERLKAKGVAL
jgi:hypothetical protein